MRLRGSRIPWLLAVCGWTGVVLLALGAVHTVRSGYLRTAELRLEPVNADRYSDDNATLPPASGRRVVFFGDSRVNGWSPRPGLPGVEQVWRGIDGETTTQMTYRYHQDVLALKPEAVVIQAGINDLVAGAALGRLDDAAALVERRIGTMVSAARDAGVRVVLTTVVPPARPPLARRIVWTDDIYAAVRAVNGRLAGLAGNGVDVIDSAALLEAVDGPLPARFATDTLHFEGAAYERLNGAVTEALRESDALQ